MGIIEKLGLSLYSVLFHAINLIILVVAFYFLLYKPIKKMIAAHKAKLDDVYAENQKLNAEASESKKKNDRMIAEMKQEMTAASAEAAERAQHKAERILDEAKLKADQIVQTAKKDAAAEKQRLRTEFRENVTHLAIDIAEKVLDREVSEQDNRDLIQKGLDEWEK